MDPKLSFLRKNPPLIFKNDLLQKGSNQTEDTLKLFEKLKK